MFHHLFRPLAHQPSRASAEPQLQERVAERLGLSASASTSEIFAALDQRLAAPVLTAEIVAQLAWPDTMSRPRDDGLSPRDRALYAHYRAAIGADQ